MYTRRFISVLAAMLSIGVCAFITFISRDVDRGTLMFNLAFLVVMLLMVLAAVAFGVFRLMQISKGLKRGTAAIRNAAENGAVLSGSQPLFQNRFLDDCYQQYRRMAKLNSDSSCDIQNFINEESVENYVRRGILELVPDILTSLGILGTFVGLVMGLREFDPSGYEQMAGSVSPLINGIKVAFITSIYGISLSLAYSFDLRSEFANLSALMDEFLDTYYLNVRPPYEIDSLSRLLGKEKNREEMTEELTGIFVEQMTKSFEQVITPAFGRMTNGINQIVDTFTRNQAQVMTQVCEAVMGQMRQELADDFSRIGQSVSELEKAQNSYMNFMDRSISHMQQAFTSLQDDLSRTGDYNSQALDQLAAAQREALRINEEQKSTYQDYIRFMYQSIEKFSDVWEKNSQALQAYSDEIAHMGPVQSSRDMQQALADISARLQDVQKRQQSSAAMQPLSPETSDTAELLELALNKLDSLEEQISAPRLFRGRRRK